MILAIFREHNAMIGIVSQLKPQDKQNMRASSWKRGHTLGVHRESRHAGNPGRNRGSSGSGRNRFESRFRPEPSPEPIVRPVI